MKKLLITPALLTAFLLCSCGGGSYSTPALPPIYSPPDAGPTTGTLAVTVNAPSGSMPTVLVNGPKSYVINNSSNLAVPAGGYTITANYLTMSDPIVGLGFLGSVIGSPAFVTLGNTTNVTVNYTQDGASGKLWVPACNWGVTPTGIVSGISGSHLRSPADYNTFTTGLTTLTTDAGCLEAVALDSKGMVWAADYGINANPPAGGNGKVWGWRVYPDGGATNPIWVTILPDGGGSAQALAFAPNGDLWVADTNNNELIRFTPSQLTTSGSPVPAAIIPDTVNGTLHSVSFPYDLAFDTGGNLWVGNAPLVANQSGWVTKFGNAGDAGLNPTPVAYLVDDGGVFMGLNGLSFDSTGKLWISNFTTQTVLKVNPSTITGQTTLNAMAVLRFDGGFIVNPQNVTFDASNNLWVIDINGGMAMYTNPSNFTGIVAPTPAVTVVNLPGTDNAQMQFDPPRAGMGLFP